MLAALVAAAPTEAAPPPDAPPGSVTTYQQNALHDGLGFGPLVTPLTQAWSVDLGQTVSYPLVVNHRVFVAVSKGQPGGSIYGAKLYAINELNGSILWGPVDLPGTYYINSIAADGQKVYSVNFDGLLRAFDQVTGQEVWQRQMPGQYAFWSAPTVIGGTIFLDGAGNGGTVYAVNAQTGSVLWTAPVESSGSSPAVTSDGVYVSYGCEVSYRLDRATGSNVWTHFTDCSGGGGLTPVVHGDRVYVRDTATKTPVILSTSSGAVLGHFSSTTEPAIDGNVRFEAVGVVESFGTFYPPFKLTAVDLTSNATLWTQMGDGNLMTAPVVIDGKVAMGSQTGTIFLFDEQTGSIVWSANAGRSILLPDEDNNRMLVGLAAADNMLFVPASDSLVAYGQPAPVGGQVDLSAAGGGQAAGDLNMWMGFAALTGIVVGGLCVRLVLGRQRRY